MLNVGDRVRLVDQLDVLCPRLLQRVHGRGHVAVRRELVVELGHVGADARLDVGDRLVSVLQCLLRFARLCAQGFEFGLNGGQQAVQLGLRSGNAFLRSGCLLRALGLHASTLRLQIGDVGLEFCDAPLQGRRTLANPGHGVHDGASSRTHFLHRVAGEVRIELLEGVEQGAFALEHLRLHCGLPTLRLAALALFQAVKLRGEFLRHIWLARAARLRSFGFKVHASGLPVQPLGRQIASIGIRRERRQVVFEPLQQRAGLGLCDSFVEGFLGRGLWRQLPHDTRRTGRSVDRVVADLLDFFEQRLRSGERTVEGLRRCAAGLDVSSALRTLDAVADERAVALLHRRHVRLLFRALVDHVARVTKPILQFRKTPGRILAHGIRFCRRQREPPRCADVCDQIVQNLFAGKVTFLALSQPLVEPVQDADEVAVGTVHRIARGLLFGDVARQSRTHGSREL